MSANYTPEAPSFKQICFMHMKALQNFPYIEADFDALTNYELLSKIVEYLNNVISNNNEQNEVVTNLYNAYVELQDYVNNYFNNLNVQDEINNKLDQMAEDGSLTLLIKRYVDPIYTAFENDINYEISTFKNNVNDELNTINAKVDGAVSGSPLVASSTSEMTDTDRVYVNTTDGKWYYYDGDSWEIGGTYQASVSSTLEDELVEQVNYIKGLDDKIALDPLNFERGGLNSDGQKYTSGYQYYVRSTDYIEITDKEFPIKFNVEDGFKFLIHYYSSNQDGTSYHTASSGWQTTEYTLNTEQNYYKMLISRVTIDTSEQADVATFVSKAYIDNSADLFTTINELKTKVNTHILPSYWTSYLESKYSTINSKIEEIGNNGDFFGFFTDYHDPQNSGKTADILFNIKDNTLINRFINNGDILTTQTKTEALQLLNKFRKDFIGLTMYNLLGNHDLNTYASSENRLTMSEVYPILFKQYENTYIHLNKDLYYYYDNDTMKIRYIFLNTNYGESAFLRDLTQMYWFIDLLNSTPDGYGVVVLTHIYFGSVDANYDLVESPAGERIRVVLNAYENKTSGSHTVDTSGASNTITFDFTNAHGYVICVITGHTHNDGYLEADGYYIIATVCDAINGSNQNPSITRTLGSYTENAIDLFFINTTSKTIDTIRIGAGSNRQFTFE